MNYERKVKIGDHLFMPKGRHEDVCDVCGGPFEGHKTDVQAVSQKKDTVKKKQKTK